MLFYALIFLSIGFILGKFLAEKYACGVSIIISIIWAFIYGPWAFVTFFELGIGIFIANLTKTKEN